MGLLESGALKELAFVESFTQANDPLCIAANIRKVVSITSEARRVKSWSAYLKTLSEKG